MDNTLPKRHVGFVKSTGSPVVIVAMDNPKHAGHCLVIQTDSLPDQFHEYLMDAVESSAGQNTVNFFDFMNRRSSPDNGLNLLQSFHRRGYIREENVNNVVLAPTPTQRYELSDVLKGMRGEQITKSEVTEINNRADTEEQRIALGKSILGQANMLMEEANKKMEEAYKIAPNLRPKEAPSFFDNQKTLIEEEIIEKIQEAPEIGIFEDPTGTVNVVIPENGINPNNYNI